MGFYDPVRYKADEHAVRPGTSMMVENATWDELKALVSSEDCLPLNALGAVAAPLYVLHGESDEVTPVDHAHHLAERAEATGAPARLVVVPGMGHDIDHTHDAWSRLWPDLVTFLNDGVTISRPGPYQP